MGAMLDSLDRLTRISAKIREPNAGKKETAKEGEEDRDSEERRDSEGRRDSV